MFPSAHILGCSTGGQINNDDVNDDEVVAAAVSFDATRLRLTRQEISDPARSTDYGEALGRSLQADDLAGVFVLSDGLNVNGSELVAGISRIIGRHIPLTGGLAGDGADFKETLVGADCAPRGAHDRGARLLWRSHSGRPWQRRRLGPVRSAPPGDEIARQCSLRTRRRAGARSLRALSRTRGIQGIAELRPSVSDPGLRSGKARYGGRAHGAGDRPPGALDDLCRRHSARLDGAADARQFRPPCGGRCRCRAAGPRRAWRRRRRSAVIDPGQLHRSTASDGSARRR